MKIQRSTHKHISSILSLADSTATNVLVLICIMFSFQLSQAQTSKNSAKPADVEKQLNNLTQTINKQNEQIQQQNSDTKKATEELKTNLENQLKQIKEMIADDKGDITQGRLVFYEDTVEIHKESGGYYYSTKENFGIDSVDIVTKDDHISEIHVYGRTKDDPKHRPFSCYNVPIQLTPDRVADGDMIKALRWVANDRGLFEREYVYISVSDFLRMEGTISYIPNSTNAKFKKEGDAIQFKKNVGINNFIKLALYTDALALFGDNPNGLAMLDFNFKQSFHMSNFRNVPIFAIKYLKANVNATRYDSKIAITHLDSNFSRSLLLQKAWVNADVSINLLNGWFTKTNHYWYWDVNAGVNMAKVTGKRDEKGRSDTVSVTSPSIATEVGIDFEWAPNFEMNVSERGIWQWSPELEINGWGEGAFFFKSRFEVSWSPLGNKASKVFFRVNYIFDATDRKNNFTQLQLGTALLLSDLLK